MSSSSPVSRVVPALAAAACLACPPAPPPADSATDPGTSTDGASSTGGGPGGTGMTSSSGTGDPTTTGVTTTTTSASGTTTEDVPADLGGGPDPASCGYTLVPVRGLQGSQAIAGDFDGDGALDLVARVPNGLARLLFNAGEGTAFTAGSEHASGGGSQIGAGDFDGDGRLDLIGFALDFADEVRVFPNIGGDFGPAIVTPMQALFYTFRVADVDGDGDDDVSEGGYHSEPVRVWHAEAGGLVEAAQLQVPACYATASDWADFDGDGDLDFAVIGDCNAVLGMPFVGVHLRDGGAYVAILDAAQAESSDTFALEAGDFDGDGAIDLVTQGWREEPAFELHRGLGDGTFGPREASPVGAMERVVRALDADADGLDDLVVEGEGVALHRGTARGFERCEVGPGRLLEAGDFDGDGDLDLLLIDGDDYTLARAP